MLKPFLLLTALTTLGAACGAADLPPSGPNPTEAIHARPTPPAPEAPEYLGIVTARKATVVPASFRARVKHLDIRHGQTVRAGDKIALLDESELKNKIEGMKHTESSSRAQAGAYGAMASKSAQDLRRQQQLASMNIIPRAQLNNTKAEIAMNNGQAGAAAESGKAAEFDRKTLEKKLEQAQIVAPSDGVVMMVRAREGEFVDDGAPIARIFDKSDLLIKFAVPKAHRDRIRKGGRVELHIEGTPRVLYASIEDFADEEAPLTSIVVIADLDDRKLRGDEVGFASIAHVKLVPETKVADARGVKR